MIVTEIGFLCPISGQPAKQLVNRRGENWLNSQLNANWPAELRAIVNAG
jgi:hypothetical protein